MGRYPDGQVRILVLGSDARPGGGFRTDIIMLVSINPKQGTATVLSFPRDLWVDLPGWGPNRINTAMVYGGFSLMASTLESNFGIRPTYYVMTNFTGFTQIIDSLGGVDVTASQTLSDKCKFPQAVRGYCTINPGVTHMNGTFALWYVRSRYSTSDFDRERRSQEVLQGAFSKLMSLNAVTRIPELFTVYQKNVETNLTLGDVVNLAPVANQLLTDRTKIRRYSIGPGEVSNWTVPSSGAMVLLPNDALIDQKIMQAVFTP
jgi:LCP family protein required for cell wall assembly